MAGRIDHVAVDSQRNVYLFDGQSSQLLSFRPDGSLRWISGARGEGPGEFTRVTGLAVSQTSIYVANLGGAKVDQVSFDGRYMESAQNAVWGDGRRRAILGESCRLRL